MMISNQYPFISFVGYISKALSVLPETKEIRLFTCEERHFGNVMNRLYVFPDNTDVLPHERYMGYYSLNAEDEDFDLAVSYLLWILEKSYPKLKIINDTPYKSIKPNLVFEFELYCIKEDITPDQLKRARRSLGIITFDDKFDMINKMENYFDF